LSAGRANESPLIALSLGSNLGPREELILSAFGRLERSGLFTPEALSSLYETSPVGIRTERWFINAACVGRGPLEPRQILDLCKKIERELGRNPAGEGRDRPIDIDIVVFGKLVVAEPDLVIPHPRMRERRFVLVPLAEIAPRLAVPPDGRRVADLRDALPPDQAARKVSSRSLAR
jgi:2-amino-4-hydroxy-6-hydroxymethyldihydropteridine diphosphokinase